MEIIYFVTGFIYADGIVISIISIYKDLIYIFLAITIITIIFQRLEYIYEYTIYLQIYFSLIYYIQLERVSCCELSHLVYYYTKLYFHILYI